MPSDWFTARPNGGGEPTSQQAVCCGDHVTDLLPGYPWTREPNPILANDAGTQQPGCPGQGPGSGCPQGWHTAGPWCWNGPQDRANLWAEGALPIITPPRVLALPRPSCPSSECSLRESHCYFASIWWEQQTSKPNICLQYASVIYNTKSQ